MPWQIACDFDGTIADEDVTDSILERFAPPTWQDIEQDWKTGRIGSRECMTRQVDLLRVPLNDLDRHLDTIAIDPGFAGFAAFCTRHKVPLTVVSDGIDYAIGRILTRHGLGHLPVAANHLTALSGDRFRLTSPHANAACRTASGTCKCANMNAAAGTGQSARYRLLIGDGASDFCAAADADLVFAKDKLLAHARHLHLPHVAFTDFAEAQRLFAALLEAPERFVARPVAGAMEPIHV